MKKIFIILASIFVAFIVESLLDEFLGRWFKPNLLLILVIFFNLSRGIRYSLWTAFLAGFLKDSFGPGVFGINIFSFIACSYLATFVKIYLYRVGSTGSRMLLVFFVDILFIGIQYILRVIFVPVYFTDVFSHILIPELVATTVVSPYVFKRYKECVSGFFV